MSLLVTLRSTLDYNPETGVFRRKVRVRGRHGAVGSVVGTLDKKGHRDISIACRRYKAHRLAWLYVYGVWPPGQLDHKDNHPDHNWIENLRLASDSQNRMNSRRPRHNTSGLKGAHRDNTRHRWMASIQKDGVTIFLGRFDTPEEAHEAYVKAAQFHFGEFARAA